MPFSRIMAMQINNADGYAKYRELMLPILAEYGGSFQYDFWISEILQKCTDKHINRVFMISFPSKQHSTEFFADPRRKEERIEDVSTYFKGVAYANQRSQ